MEYRLKHFVKHCATPNTAQFYCLIINKNRKKHIILRKKKKKKV